MTTEINANMKAKVGALSSQGNGSLQDIRMDQYGNLLVSSAKAVAAAAGRLYSVANQAAVATTAGLATTWTGLGISNPAGSGKNAILHEFGAALAVVGSDEGVYGLMTSDTTGFAAALTVKNALNSGGGSVLYADDGATIATPILERIVATYGTGAITTAMMYGPGIYHLDGSYVLEPGRSIMTYTTTATTAAFVFHFVWEEVDR